MNIPILHDDIAELAETFSVSLRDLQGTQAAVDTSATGTITIHISDGGIVSFEESTVIPDQVYVVNRTIAPVILPEPIAADLQNDTLVMYTLNPIPAGMSFDPETRTLSGMPTVLTTTSITLTYTARSFYLADGPMVLFSTSTFKSTSASLTFSVTVAETGVVSVRHYSDAAAATLITDLVSSGDVYSVVAFSGNVDQCGRDGRDRPTGHRLHPRRRFRSAI